MHRVLIIGCGNIAGGFDAARAADAHPLTHAGAYRRHGGFELVACVDPDADRRDAFRQRWSIGESAASIEKLGCAEGRFDVISICSPTALHAEHLAQAVALRPRLIFCEKPVAPALAQTERWVAACRDAGIALAVNHTRRWAPDVVRLAADLRAGRHGVVRSVIGHYNKGVLNNGGHLVDLLHLLFGAIEVVACGEPVWDHWPDDPTIPALLHGPGGLPIHLATGHAGDYACFELQIVTSRGTLTMENGGLRWRHRDAVASGNFKGYLTLDEGHAEPGEYDLAMLQAAANLYDCLTHGAALASDGESALQAQRICEAIRQGASPTFREA